jgi:hypothetical protein
VTGLAARRLAHECYGGFVADHDAHLNRDVAALQMHRLRPRAPFGLQIQVDQWARVEGLLNSA